VSLPQICSRSLDLNRTPRKNHLTEEVRYDLIRPDSFQSDAPRQ
jgi:hypothetical protein